MTSSHGDEVTPFDVCLLRSRSLTAFQRYLMTTLPKFLALVTSIALGSGIAAAADYDWPQWRGPNRDDVSKETGLLKQWPAEGPKKLWSFDKAGNGYAGISTAAGKLYTMGVRDGKEVLFSVDTGSGKEVWATPMGEAFRGGKP